MSEKLTHWLARHLPKRLVLWCFVVVIADATTGKYGKTIVPELTAVEAMRRYSTDNNL